MQFGKEGKTLILRPQGRMERELLKATLGYQELRLGRTSLSAEMTAEELEAAHTTLQNLAYHIQANIYAVSMNDDEARLLADCLARDSLSELQVLHLTQGQTMLAGKMARQIYGELGIRSVELMLRNLSPPELGDFGLRPEY